MKTNTVAYKVVIDDPILAFLLQAAGFSFQNSSTITTLLSAG